METRQKKACVSTLYLKWYLIIGELQNTPWPRPANAHIGFIKLFAAISELNCDCRLRIDPSAAVYFPDFSRLYYSRKWQNVRWIGVWPDKLYNLTTFFDNRDSKWVGHKFDERWKKEIYFERKIHSSSIKYPSISEATSGIKARMMLSSFWCRLPASSMLPNHRIDLSMLHN